MKLSEDGASVLIQGNSEKTDLKYPAVTICPEVSTKYAIAEKIGNLVNPMNLPEDLLSLRHDFFMCAAGFSKKPSGYESILGYERLYNSKCSESHVFGCQVLILNTYNI